MSRDPSGLNRRDFLKAAEGLVGAGLLAAGFPAIVPASALGREGRLPPSERVRVGPIGVKNQGTGNLKALLRKAETVALCDVDREVLQAARKVAELGTLKTVETFGDYRRVLDRKDVDAVVVTSPDHWHARITVDACMAGKDVYCEKPLSLTVAEGRAMADAAKKYGRIVQTGSQQRSDDKFRLACELVRNGKLGRLKGVTVGLPAVNYNVEPAPDSAPPAELDYNFWLGPAPDRPYNKNHVHYNFRFFWDYSGGQMTNWGAHHLDIVQWALGMDESGPVEIEATATFDPKKQYEVPATMKIRYTYKYGGDDLIVTCEQGTKARGGVTFEGTEGILFVTRGKIEAPEEILKSQFSGSDTRLYVSKNHHDNWLECIASRKAPICEAEIGHRSATVCHLGNIAARTGRILHWDPKAEAIGGDPEAHAMLRRPYRAPWEHPKA
ncbi:MAG: Gfo/Idh/MocA family oxidoreductase [Isosphaeraceae bacterium]